MTSSTNETVDGAWPFKAAGSITAISGTDKMLLAIETMSVTNARRPQVRQKAPLTSRHDLAIDAAGPRRSKMKIGTATASRPHSSPQSTTPAMPPSTAPATPRPGLTRPSSRPRTMRTSGVHGMISARTDTTNSPNQRLRTDLMISPPSACWPITAFPTTPVTTPASRATHSALTTSETNDPVSPAPTDFRLSVPLSVEVVLNDVEPNVAGTLFSARPTPRRMSSAMTESTAAKPNTILGYLRIVEKLPSRTSPTDSGRSGTMPGLYSCW